MRLAPTPNTPLFNFDRARDQLVADLVADSGIAEDTVRRAVDAQLAGRAQLQQLLLTPRNA